MKKMVARMARTLARKVMMRIWRTMKMWKLRRKMKSLTRRRMRAR